LRQWEVVRVPLCRLDRVGLEYDHDAELIRARIVLAHNPCLPEPPHVGDFFPQVGFELLVRDPGFHAIEGDDLHDSRSFAMTRATGPRSTRTSRRRSMRVTGSLLDAGALKTTHRSVSCEPGIRGRRNAMVHSLRRKFSCPVELSLEMLGGKWKTVILAYLKQG